MFFIISLMFFLTVLPQHNLFKITLYDDLNLFFRIHRCYKNTMYTCSVRSINICKQLISNEECILLIRSHQFHCCLISFDRWFICFVYIIFPTDCLAERFHSWFFVVTCKTIQIGRASCRERV